MKILYDWRGMPIEFIQQPQPTGSSSDTLFKLTMAYDGSGRRISKTSMRKVAGAADWDTTQVTHYTGIGTEIRENYAGPVKETKVVVNMPNGLGRYGIEDAGSTDNGSGAGDIPNAKFEWYLKNHLGSTMLVYGTQSDATPAPSDIGTPLAAYDYRAFGEMIELTPSPTGKVTENFTGKEHDDEIALDYFGARYLDPMLGMWTSVDPARQFASPYLYAGNGMNPVNVIDPDGNSVNILLSNEKSGSFGFVYKYKSYQIKAKPELGKYRRRVPRYNMYIGNNSGSDAIIEVTRDAIAGNGPFIANGSFRGWPLFNAPNGYRIELRDPKTLSRTILDDQKQKRSYVQIHLGPGCSEGCSLLPDGKKGRDRFQEIIETMQKEDLDNGFDDDIFVDTEKFDPAFTPKDVPGPDVH